MNQDCATTEQEVLARLQALYNAYSRQNLDEIVSFFAPDPDVVVIGTAEDERVVGIEEIRSSWKRSVDEPVKLEIAITWHKIACRGAMALFCVDLHYAVELNDEATVNLVTRASGVMEKREDELLVCQYHASHPTPAFSSRYAQHIPAPAMDDDGAPCTPSETES